MSAASKRRREKGRAWLTELARQPFGPWERRDVRPEDLAGFEQAIGRRATDGVRAITHGFTNNRYGVWFSEVETPAGPAVHLWIRRHDGARLRDWADLQRIKDELVGAERVAVEVVPARESLVDDANMYHLWVLPPGFELPFSLKATTQEETPDVR
jgi:hypothetical protein